MPRSCAPQATYIISLVQGSARIAGERALPKGRLTTHLPAARQREPPTTYDSGDRTGGAVPFAAGRRYRTTAFPRGPARFVSTADAFRSNPRGSIRIPTSAAGHCRPALGVWAPASPSHSRLRDPVWAAGCSSWPASQWLSWTGAFEWDTDEGVRLWLRSLFKPAAGS